MWEVPNISSRPGLNVYLPISHFPDSSHFCQVDTKEHSNVEGHLLKIMEHQEESQHLKQSHFSIRTTALEYMWAKINFWYIVLRPVYSLKFTIAGSVRLSAPLEPNGLNFFTYKSLRNLAQPTFPFISSNIPHYVLYNPTSPDTIGPFLTPCICGYCSSPLRRVFLIFLSWKSPTHY